MLANVFGKLIILNLLLLFMVNLTAFGVFCVYCWSQSVVVILGMLVVISLFLGVVVLVLAGLDFSLLELLPKIKF